MGHIWLVPTPSFERSHSIKMIMWHSILDIGCRVYSLSPKLWWKYWMCIRNRMLHLDTCIFAILDELRLDILTTIFIYEDLESPPRLVLNQGSKDLEEVKNFKLVI